jgi:subtilase family serine protease
MHRPAALGAIALAALLAAAPAAARPNRRVCAWSTHQMSCDARVVTDAQGTPLVTTGPSGYGPADLQSAYGLTVDSLTGGLGKTIAVVDAYDYPHAAADLAVYRSQFGLPPCGTTDGCFRKVNEKGGTRPPRANLPWAQEEALDLQMASAVCPNCHLILVEATSGSTADLGTSVNTAVKLGAQVVSNSYGSGESASDTTYDTTYYKHPGIAITVASGDAGYGVEYPAASRFVTAVGGTSLTRAPTTARGWSETAWSGAGSGCSAYDTKPNWQTDTACSKRNVADVSAVADPNTGVSVYATSATGGGWLVFGGTSTAAPIIAGVYALGIGTVNYGSLPYSHTSSLFDVLSGSNGTCTTYYECHAAPGYDGPTGLGTPNGAGAF